jgi:hypothetical protein
MRRLISYGAVVGVVLGGMGLPLTASAAGAAATGAGATGDTRTIQLGASSSPTTGSFVASGRGDVTSVEFAGEEDGDDGPPAYPGFIVDRGISKGHGKGGPVKGHGKAKSNPYFVTGFEGLNLFQQRYARGGNQFTVEPPDQGLCVGNGYQVEAVNDVINVYDRSGHSLLPDNTSTNIVSGFPTDVGHAVDLNSFYGYPSAIDRSTGVRGPNLTDPTCIYDAQSRRFFLVVLTLETTPAGAFTTANHLDLAVSKTSNPTGTWNIYKIDVTGDGSNPSPANACPCLGDYPHIGADAHGIYLTTNAYPWNGSGFDGAQIYALPKEQLAAGASSVKVAHFDTFGAVHAPSDAGATQPGFTVWPAQSPGTSSYDTSHKGTEYLLSSNAADEATHPVAGTGGNYVSDKLVVWSLTNTASLATGHPVLTLSNKLIGVNTYAVPPKQQQPGSGTRPGSNVPQGHCINDTTTVTTAGVGCWRLLLTTEPAHDEVVSRPDSNDTRMQQVTYANGMLWGALDTALNPDGGGQRAGIAWYVLKPDAKKVVVQGYLGAAGHDFTYPAIGVTAGGRGVMAFTATGDTLNPSAAYAAIDAKVGVRSWNTVPGGVGAAPDDGFTGYKAQVGNPPRPRWGDYGAAAVDGNAVWVASEYIASACSYQQWGGRFFGATTGDNKLGTCAQSPGAAGSRTALGNWSTRISKFVP